ncbi:hypothetical protein Tsubulata_042606 [Turnera subulata]|uniref:Aminotransferase-like plant mobile domain-containing protein n=1 Tax=Turnera subulata TaxID=218843 RepID=A0A9Q0G161_9ROSI|nr:hypothetical protein Tsubulata_042606 [Turnera subulata]
MATYPSRSFDNLPLDILWDLQESSSLSDSAKRDRFFALIDRIGLRGPLFETWVADSLVISLGPAAINDHPILEKVCPLSRPNAIPWGRSISLRDYTNGPPLKDQYPIQTWPYEPSTGLGEWRQWINRLSSVLFGLPPHGHDFGIVSSENSIFSDEFISSWSGKSYIVVMRQPECTLCFVPLVLHLLESDNPIALGPLVLASIYKGLHQLTTETPGELHSSASGPLWLVQIWLMASLPELTRVWPQNFRLDSSTSYGYQFVLPLPAQVFLRDESADHPDYAATWKSILAARDLPSDLTALKNEPRTSVEVYHPHYYVAQLGFYQHVPVPLVFSRNQLSLHDHAPFSCTQEEEAISFVGNVKADLLLGAYVHLLPRDREEFILELLLPLQPHWPYQVRRQTRRQAFLWILPLLTWNTRMRRPRNLLGNLSNAGKINPDQLQQPPSFEKLIFPQWELRSSPLPRDQAPQVWPRCNVSFSVFLQSSFCLTLVPSSFVETGETFGDDVSSSFPGYSFLPEEIPSAVTPGASHFQASVVELPAVSGSSHHAPVPIFPSTADVSRDLIISEDTSWGCGPSGLSKLWGSPDYWGQHPTGRISTSPAAALDSSSLPAEVLPNPSPGLVNSSGSFSFPALSPAVSEPGNIGEFFSVNSPSPVVPFSSVGPSTDVAVLTALSNRESSAGDGSHAPIGERTINRAAADHSTRGSAQVPVPLHIDELNLQRLVSTLLDSLRDPTVVAEIRAVCTCLLAPPSPLGQDLHARSS